MRSSDDSGVDMDMDMDMDMDLDLDLEFIVVEVLDKVAKVTLNRPTKANALHGKIWQEYRQVMEKLDDTPEVRAIVLCGEGKHFCAGIDFAFMGEIAGSVGRLPDGRKHEKLRRTILDLQDCLSSAERCRKPVIAAIHGLCIGAGVDMVSACDIRVATEGARFSIKEIDIGIVADVGTLQRLPYLVSQGTLRDWAYTGREFAADEAVQKGLVDRMVADLDLMEEAVGLARAIARKSPLAIRGVKTVLEKTKEMSVESGLDYVATWNASMLLSKDAQIAAMAAMTKKEPEFED